MEDQVVGPDLKLATERAGARATVSIAGELDAYSAPSLEEEVARLLEDGVSDLVFDLSATKFLDSSGLRAILTAQRASPISKAGSHCGRRAIRCAACSTSPA
jgi:anti-anti-sigma factor